MRENRQHYDAKRWTTTALFELEKLRPDYYEARAALERALDALRKLAPENTG